jgi:hypothetical protein
MSGSASTTRAEVLVLSLLFLSSCSDLTNLLITFTFCLLTLLLLSSLGKAKTRRLDFAVSLLRNTELSSKICGNDFNMKRTTSYGRTRVSSFFPFFLMVTTTTVRAWVPSSTHGSVVAPTAVSGSSSSMSFSPTTRTRLRLASDTAAAAAASPAASDVYVKPDRVVLDNTLYVYDHCPFCVRVRIALGIKNVKHNLHFMANDDVNTPTRLVGKKIAPIFVSCGGMSYF